MTSRELELNAETLDEFFTAQRGVAAAVAEGMYSHSELNALRELRATVPNRRMLPSLPDGDTLGLNDSQVVTVLQAVGLLLDNVPHGLGAKPKGSAPTPDYKEFGSALSLAREMRLPGIHASVRFDDNSGEGKVAVSHPIVPGYTAGFSKETAIADRQARLAARRIPLGHTGLQTIEQVVPEVLETSGLTSSPIEVQDQYLDPNNPLDGGRRIFSFTIHSSLEADTPGLIIY